MATENRLIDANSLTKTIKTVFGKIRTDWDAMDRLFNQVQELVLDIVKKAPTVDAVEVVRCKDCKHYDNGGCGKCYGEYEPNQNDFCSCGERKDNDK